MKKAIYSIIAFMFVFVPTYAGEPNEQLERKELYPTVKVANEEGYGSGTVIRSVRVDKDTWCNVVLTCCHVTSEMADPKILIPGWAGWSKIDEAKNKTFDSITYVQNEKRDMAFVVFLSHEQLPVAEIGLDEHLYISNEVERVGCACDDYPRLEHGYVTGVTDEVLRTAMCAIPGDSGGPIFHHGKLVAITQRIAIVHDIPVFQDSKNVRVTNLIPWEKEDRRAGVYKSTAALPKFTIIRLQVRNFHPKAA